ncbi:carboxymuconolactone decarboxylase family protein [Pseudomonas sp. NA-150]|uniref:carboxymuconolactone decarboxylase family protein n=1 Tax=Pseudomonas sp. NA-150 TaxID=3367525 RepID=UPI0037CAFDA1
MEPRLDYYAASPEAVTAILKLEAANFDFAIEKPLLELIKLRVSQINGCSFCTDLHATEARKSGETERRLHALPVWRDAPFFSARERAGLAWAESVTLVAQTHIPDDIYALLCSEFSERERVDLTVAIATINSWNRLAVSFRAQPTL